MHLDTRAQPGDMDDLKKICLNLSEQIRDAQCNVCNSTYAYRTFSGCCNNVEKEMNGEANRPLLRLLNSSYSGTKSLPRGGLASSSLPSPRKVSSAIHRSNGKGTSPSISVMLMQFGQFLDHDIALTPEQGQYQE